MISEDIPNDVRKMHKKVREIIQHINALERLTVIIPGVPEYTTLVGRIVVSEGQAVVFCQPARQTGG